MRRTLASPNLAISSNRPAAMRGEVLSASIRTAKRRGWVFVGHVGSPCDVASAQQDVGGERQAKVTAIRMKAMAPPNGQFVFCVNSL